MNQKTEKRAAYTAGPIGPTMLKTALGMLAGTLAMSGYNIADTYFVGQLGKTPLAAMGFTFPVIMLVGCLFHGLGIGLTTNAAQSLGGNRPARAAKLISSGLLLLLIVSLAVAAGGMLTIDRVFEWLGAEGETLEMVKSYMNIWYFGCATAGLSMGCNGLLIAVGAAKSAGGMMMAGMIVNVLLDPLFIFGWGPVPAMGIRGAALATIGSQLFVSVVLLTLLYRKYRLLEFRFIPYRRLRESWKLIADFAIPGTAGMLMLPLGSTVLTRITAHFGDTAVAATAAAGRLEMVAFVFPMSLGMSMLPMVGQNYGARLYSRIRICRRFAMNFAFFFLTGMAVIYYFASPYLVGFFSKDAEVQAIMTQAMHIIPWGFGMIEIHRYSGFFFTGCNRPAVAAYLNALRILGLMIPFSLLALYFDSLSGLFWARLAADVTAGVVGLVLVISMTRRLPADGAAPPLRRSRGIAKLAEGLLRQRASAQADIDGKGQLQ